MQNLNQSIGSGVGVRIGRRPAGAILFGQKWGPEMGKTIISLLLLATAWMPGIAAADELVLAEDAPDRYVVIKGDTLWDISGRFLRDPWRWPDIWGLNKEEIRNPHWIYPGDVVYLDFSGATPRLRREGDSAGRDDGGVGGAGGDWELVTTKLSPTMRRLALDGEAIASIPMSAIGAFLSKPLVVGKQELEAAPILVAAQEGRVILSKGDTVFAKGVLWEEGPQWSVFRPGREMIDPDTKELLGVEAVHLGEAQVNDFGEVSTLSITDTVLEIAPGDRLVKTVPVQTVNFIPRAPEATISGKVILSSVNSVSEIGPKSVVVLNRGGREGLEPGHVLALYRDRPMVKPAGASNPGERIALPRERYGLVFVFRVFEKVSYALVMDTTRPVNLNDVVQTP